MAVDVAGGRCLHELFEDRVRLTPTRAALIHRGAGLSYAQLNNRANKLAHTLMYRGVGPGTVVGLALPRCPDMVIAILAALKTGAAYVPLDPAYPLARLHFMLADADAALLVSTVDLASRLRVRAVPHLLLDAADDAAAVLAAPGTDPTGGDRSGPLTPADAAYVLYTSGSTGTPKGVVVPHSGLINLFDQHLVGIFAAAVNKAGGRQAVRAAQTASFSFDVSWDHLLWMFAGHELHIIDDATRSDPDACVAYLAEHRIDYVGTTPSYLELLVSAGLLEKRFCPGTIAVGGEAISEQLWSRLRSADGVAAFHFYGTTECTVDSLVANVADTLKPTLGAPILNTRVYVLDDALEPVPEGAVGELCVSGAGLARGYLGNPELTTRRFVECPFEHAGDRMYRTGDLVRYNSNGDLTFVGRLDDQLKIRGFRIEPGEIEATLCAHPGVAAAAVVARDDPGTLVGKRLVAYLIPADPQPGPSAGGRSSVWVDELRGFARDGLPEYMVPSAFIPIAEFPLTPNGKLDHSALPDAGAPATTSRAPRTATERALCPLFAQVLGVEQVGIDDDLFDLGGPSLLAIRLARLIATTLDTGVSVRSVLAAPTVAGLSELIDAGIDLDPFETVLALRGQGSRPPLFCLPPAGGIGWFYAGFVPHLHVDHPIYALQAPALGRPRPVRTTELPSFEQTIIDYVAHIQALQPRGPYHLLGWSLGGTWAHAVAVALRKRGEAVVSLSILDARPVHPGDDLQPIDPDAVREILAEFTRAALPHDPAGTEDGVDGLEWSGPTLSRILGELEPADLNDLLTLVAHDSTLLPQAPQDAFDGTLLFFHPNHDSWVGTDPESAWRSLIAGSMTIHQLDCGHAEMAHPQIAAQIGRIISEQLNNLHGADRA